MNTTTAKRPERWDEPFGQFMTAGDVERILSYPPFSEMNPELFPDKLPLNEILLNDCRVNEYQEGDIIVREGDYGNSAFLVLEGEVDVCLTSLPESVLGRATPRKKGLLRTLAQLWSNHRSVEYRAQANALANDSSSGTNRNGTLPGNIVGARESKNGTRVFLQDVPRVLDGTNLVSIHKGELFGEVAALSRSPRTATVIARAPASLLEIRWQGLREIIKYDPVLRNYVDELYRENSLQVHLRETPFLHELPSEKIQLISDLAKFESYGDFDWQNHYRKINRKEIGQRIALEPAMAIEGEYINDLILIRNGFARMSRQIGEGHQTLAYLGKGEVFGLREIARSWHSNEERRYDFSLRAVGLAEVIRIPVDLVENNILPYLGDQQLDELLSQSWLHHIDSKTDPDDVESELETGLIEFLGEYRFINGTQTMLIDLDRCTRCDDCVRACADTHDNNPRFTREGPKFGNQMVASACMHCQDPVCMIGCPTGAIGRDMSTGNILINDQTCIGCSTCANSCPYNNIKMVEISDRRGNPIVDEQSQLPILKATKCDLCTDQLGGPACVRACPHDAMIRIPTNDANTLTQWINR